MARHAAHNRVQVGSIPTLATTPGRVSVDRSSCISRHCFQRGYSRPSTAQHFSPITMIMLRGVPLN